MEKVNSFLQSLEIFWAQLSQTLPMVFAALLLMILGWIIARVVRKITEKTLKFLKVDVVAEKSGIEDFLLRGGVRFTSVTLVSNLIYWFILFTILLAVLNMLGLQVAAELFNRIIFYIPNVVVAVIVLIFGALFARFVQGVTLTYLSNIGLSGARFMSVLAQYAILVFVASVALEQLDIGGDILVSAFQLSFGALCLALALAFGLGGRDWASRILENAWKKTQ